MKAYRVNVNGNVYEITIEQIDKSEINTAPKAESAPAPSVVATPAGVETIKAPMPGTILKVNVTAGQAVKKGDILFILEAMKMENEIMAPCDGTIGTVSVANGASVENGTALCTLK
jgi:biotin carboxyl carrier protein